MTKGDGTVDGTVGTTLVSVVSLAGSVCIPVKADLDAEALGFGLGLEQRLTNHFLAGRASVSAFLPFFELGSDSVTATHRLGLGEPLFLESDELGDRRRPRSRHGWRMSTKGSRLVLVVSENEGVVTPVDVGGDVGSRLGIGTGNDEVLNTHDVVLETNGNQTVNVLLDGDKHLTGHVTTLFGTGSLVLNVDTGGTLFDKELGELHDGSETAVTSVGVGNNGTEVVDDGRLGALLGREVGSLLALLAVVEELCHEEVLNLEGDGVVRVVSQIGTGLVGGRGGGRTLPTRDVDGFEVLGHLGHLDGVKGTVSVRSGTLGSMALERLPEFLGLDIGSVRLLEGAAFRRSTLLGNVGSGDAGKARTFHHCLTASTSFLKKA